MTISKTQNQKSQTMVSAVVGAGDCLRLKQLYASGLRGSASGDGQGDLDACKTRWTVASWCCLPSILGLWQP